MVLPPHGCTFFHQVPLVGAKSAARMLAAHVENARRALARWEVVSTRVRQNGGAANFFPMSELWALNNHAEVLALNHSLATKLSEDSSGVNNGDGKARGGGEVPQPPTKSALPSEALTKEAEAGAAAALSCLFPAALLPSGRAAVALFTSALSEQWMHAMSNSTDDRHHDDDEDDDLQDDDALKFPTYGNHSVMPSISSSQRSAEQRLSAACEALDHSVKVVRESGARVPRLRSLTFADNTEFHEVDLASDGSEFDTSSSHGSSISGSIPNGGLQLVVVESPKAALAEALSAFGNHGALPEWHNFLHVHRQMPFDVVTTFVRRAATRAMPPKLFSKSPRQPTSDELGGSKKTSNDHPTSSNSNLHVLVTPETLPLETQYRLLELLRSFTDQQSGPLNLLIVCVQAHSRDGAPMVNTDSRSPLLTQLGSYRRGPEAWSNQRLRDLWEQNLSKSPLSGGMELFTSLSPGAGKSFEARRGAAARGERYVYVRVNRSVMSPCELSALLQQRLHDAEEEEEDDLDADEDDVGHEDNVDGPGTKTTGTKAENEDQDYSTTPARKSSKVCVHLDLAETVQGSSLDRTLFSLLVLGCLPNYGDNDGSIGTITTHISSGSTDFIGKSNHSNSEKAPMSRFWWWHPSTTSFAIELKSSLINFPSLSWMPRRVMAPSSKTFCANHAALLAGCGHTAFHSARYDGTLDVLAGLGNRADAPLPREVI